MLHQSVKVSGNEFQKRGEASYQILRKLIDLKMILQFYFS
jgi:hypothetical protein